MEEVGTRLSISTVARSRFAFLAFLRLPPLLFVILIIAALVTALPAATGDTTADGILGQVSFTIGTAPSSIDGNSLSDPWYVAIDPYSTPNHVYVVDSNPSSSNNRVLGWYDVASFKNQRPADIVFGQPDFLHTGFNNGVSGIGPDSLGSPKGLAVDTLSNLYIADSGNQRILEFNDPFHLYNPASGPRLTPPGTSPGSAGDTVADRVFGTCGSFTGQSCVTTYSNCADPSLYGLGGYTASELALFQQVTFEPGTDIPLFIPAGLEGVQVDYSRVGQWQLSCDVVTHLQDQIAAPAAVAIDPVTGTLYASNTNPAAIYEYDTPLISQTATRAFGNCHPAGGFDFSTSCTTSDSPGPKTLFAPSGIAVDQYGNLFVADGPYLGTPIIQGRVMMYLNPRGSSTGCNPGVDGSGCAGDTTADSVFGTCGGGFTTEGCSGISSGFLDYGFDLWDGIAVDKSENLYAMDPANSRALRFSNANLIPNPSPTAVQVFGQHGSFTTNLPNNGGLSADSLGVDATDIAIDGSCNVYITDGGNNRVLEYDQPAGLCGGPTPTPTATSTGATSTPTATATPAATPSATIVYTNCADPSLYGLGGYTASELALFQQVTFEPGTDIPLFIPAGLEGVQVDYSRVGQWLLSCTVVTTNPTATRTATATPTAKATATSIPTATSTAATSTPTATAMPTAIPTATIIYTNCADPALYGLGGYTASELALFQQVTFEPGTDIPLFVPDALEGVRLTIQLSINGY